MGDATIAQRCVPDAETGSCGTFACRLSGNLLDADWTLPAGSDGPTTLIAWSGSLADTLFERHPHTWMQPGQDALRRVCDALVEPLVTSGRTLNLQPHARHVLSDPQSAINFAREREDGPFGIVLGPTTMLEPSMLGEVEDHLTRAFATLGERAVAVVLQDAVVDATTESLSSVRLGEGEIPGRTVGRLLRSCVPAETPILVHPDDLGRLDAWLAS